MHVDLGVGLLGEGCSGYGSCSREREREREREIRIYYQLSENQAFANGLFCDRTETVMLLSSFLRNGRNDLKYALNEVEKIQRR